MQQVKKVNLAINGFGRIGRCFLRAALKDSEFMNLVNFKAINVFQALVGVNTWAS